MITPTYRLDCAGCGTYLGMSEWPMLCTGTVRWAPSGPDGLRYTRCRCGVVSRWEILPNLTPDELMRLRALLAAAVHLSVSSSDHQEAAA